MFRATAVQNAPEHRSGKRLIGSAVLGRRVVADQAAIRTESQCRGLPLPAVWEIVHAPPPAVGQRARCDALPQVRLDLVARSAKRHVAATWVPAGGPATPAPGAGAQPRPPPPYSSPQMASPVDTQST